MNHDLLLVIIGVFWVVASLVSLVCMIGDDLKNGVDVRLTDLVAVFLLSLIAPPLSVGFVLNMMVTWLKQNPSLNPVIFKSRKAPAEESCPDECWRDGPCDLWPQCNLRKGRNV